MTTGNNNTIARFKYLMSGTGCTHVGNALAVGIRSCSSLDNLG